jgi:hypothetical protein
MNPVLYAFLSDNFKKSFLKACRFVMVMVIKMFIVMVMVIVINMIFDLGNIPGVVISRSWLCYGHFVMVMFMATLSWSCSWPLYHGHMSP